MQHITVDDKFGLELDDEMYELARAALAEEAPEQRLGVARTSRHTQPSKPLRYTKVPIFKDGRPV